MTGTSLDITIVSGMSGAGRSTAADVLEDLGFFVIDNLPPELIVKVSELARGHANSRYALVVDIRSGTGEELETALAALRSAGADTRMLFLDASDEVLLRRFDATRRPHPLAGSEGVIRGIERERRALAELKAHADVVIDTSELTVHTLRARLQQLFAEPGAQSHLQASVVSFGYKHGLPLDVDLVFDCRFLPNPHWVESLRPQTGLDHDVREYVLSQDSSKAFLDELQRLFALLVPEYEKEGKAYLTIGIGCTGGRHRSVAIAQAVAEILAGIGHSPRITHRDIERA